MIDSYTKSRNPCYGLRLCLKDMQKSSALIQQHMQLSCSAICKAIPSMTGAIHPDAFDPKLIPMREIKSI